MAEYGGRKIKSEGELEVTGVSRSGRVRKKSSKLTDFENLDELDMRSPKNKKEKLDFPTPTSRPVKKGKNQMKVEIISDEEEPNVGGFTVTSGEVYLNQGPLSDVESENEYLFNQIGDSILESLGSDIDDGYVDIGGDEGFQPITGEPIAGTSSQAVTGPGNAGEIVELVGHKKIKSQEKSYKKRLVKTDGKVVGKMKPQRKDKGTTRFTAYMLWAKEIRAELVKHNPDLDFSQISKKLGELWATVPSSEKYIWKRRAKRLAARGKSKQAPKKAQQNQQQLMNVSAKGAVVKKGKSAPVRKYVNKNLVSSSAPAPIPVTVSSTDSESSEELSPSVSVVDSNGSSYKPNTTPLDVAAHLRLLGESLTVIGERLTEHEGQITVSGSLSLLLDSLLCSMAPLLCLTQQIPKMNVVPPEKFSKLLDNISYIMPGL